MISQKELTERLDYNPDTGDFTWLRILPYSNFNVGDIAGNYNNLGYHRIKLNGRTYQSHRLAWLYMTGSFPVKFIDHINHDRADNRFCNLREADHSVNGKNQKRQVGNKSGVTGVCFATRASSWKVSVSSNLKQIHLGYFKDFFEAVCARKSAEIKYNYHPNHGKR